MHGKAGPARRTVSDWMEMEKARGISITSAALQFAYRDHVVNLVDTPGHADFSEDTYRVLAAVDCRGDAGRRGQGPRAADPEAVRGLPAPRHPGDHRRSTSGTGPGLDALELMDEIERADRAAPHAADLAGRRSPATSAACWTARDGRAIVRYTRTAGGATMAPEERLSRRAGRRPTRATAWAARPSRRPSCSPPTAPTTTRSCSWPATTTPVLFASAVSNFGVAPLLDVLVDLAPAPTPARPGRRRRRRARSTRRSAASSSRCRPAWTRPTATGSPSSRVCSGVFERGMVVTHAATGRPFATKYAQPVFGRERDDDRRAPSPATSSAWSTPARCGVGDTLYVERRRSSYPPIADASRPEHFAAATRRRHRPLQAVPARASSSSTRRASSRCCARTCAATRRRCSPRWARCSSRWSSTGWSTSSTPRSGWTGSTTASPGSPTPSRRRSWPAARGRGLTRARDGALLALFTDKWRMRGVMRDHPDLVLNALLADTRGLTSLGWCGPREVRPAPPLSRGRPGRGPGTFRWGAHGEICRYERD